MFNFWKRGCQKWSRSRLPFGTSQDFCGVRVAQSLDFCVVLLYIIVYLYVLSLLAIALYFLHSVSPTNKTDRQDIT
jgi:hypothetical protein